MAIDWTILDGIQKIFGGSFMDWLMPKITVLGNGGIVWIIIAVCLISVSYTHLDVYKRQL